MALDLYSNPWQLPQQQQQMFPTFGGMPQGQPLDPLQQFFMALSQRFSQPQQQMDPSAFIKTALTEQRNDPVGDFSKRASLPSYAPESQSPFSTGYFNQPSSAGLSPEAVQASQGNSATNQWAQLGGIPGVDPQQLKQLNSIVASRRLR